MKLASSFASNIASCFFLSAIFFAFAPSHEFYFFLFLLIGGVCLLLFDFKDCAQNLFRYLTVPLLLHMLIAFVQMVIKLFRVESINLFQNLNLRSATSIGPKNTAIICSLVLLLQIYTFIRSRRIHFFDLGVYFFVIVTLSLLNSLNGLLSLIWLNTAFYIFGRYRFSETNRTFFNNIRSIVFFGYFAYVLFFPFSGGMTRIVRLADSFSSAFFSHHSISSTENPAWSSHQLFYKNYCLNPEKECAVDASTYYRLSWIQFGVKYLLRNPMGIGNVESPFDTIVKSEYSSTPSDASVSRDFHSEILSFSVKFGITSTFFIFYSFAVFIWYFVRRIGTYGVEAGACSLGLGMILFQWFAFDTIGGGGLFFGLTFLMGVSLFIELRRKND